jgi:hypothetical protein
MVAGAPDVGLLSLIAPLTAFSWQELFKFHLQDVPRLRQTIAGKSLGDISNGEQLRSLLILGVRAPLERFLAGLDYSEFTAATGTAREQPGKRTDFLGRLGTAATARATRGSRIACLDLLRNHEQVELLRAGIAAMRNDGLHAPGINYLEVETARLGGEYARAFQFCIEPDNPVLWGEFAAPRLRQLASLCREWGLPELALPWLREWLCQFPDSPDSGEVWLDRCLNALASSADFEDEARESFNHARSLLGDVPGLCELEAALTNLA